MAKNILKKEFSIGEILSDSWNRFTKNFSLIALVALFVYVPVNLILTSIPLEETVASVLNYMKYAIVLEGLFGVLAMMSIAYIIKSSIDGKLISVGDAFSKSFRKWPKLIWTMIIFGLFLTGLGILLVIPAIIFYVYWYFVSYVVLFTDNYGTSALSYSKEIVKGRWWKVLGYMICFGLIAVAVFLTFEWLFLPTSDLYWTNFLYNLVIDVMASFFIVVATVFFVNFDATKQKVTKKKA